MIIWPKDLAPRKISVNATAVTIGGPASLSGFRQNVSSPAAMWSVGFSEVPLLSEQKKRLWRTIAMLAEGRAEQVVIPIFDVASLRMYSGTEYATAPHGDDSTYSDNAEYSQSPIHIETAVAVNVGATVMTATVVVGGPIDTAQFFSYGYRLYVVRKILSVDGSNVQFSFWPPARDGMIAGADLDFFSPKLKVRLKEDNSMHLELGLANYAVANVDFLEDPS